MITYGEAYVEYQRQIHSNEHNLCDDVSIPKHKPRMSRSDASVYYSDKIKREFVLLGYDMGTEYKSKGFDSVDDYYDYHEAMRMVA